MQENLNILLFVLIQQFSLIKYRISVSSTDLVNVFQPTTSTTNILQF